MSDISILVDELRRQADIADEKSIKLREALAVLSGAGVAPKPKRGWPTASSGYRLTGVERLIKDIPVKASKKTGKKRKYTKRSAFWKKKK